MVRNRHVDIRVALGVGISAVETHAAVVLNTSPLTISTGQNIVLVAMIHAQPHQTPPQPE
jgi:hypothetical protein